MLKHVIAGDQSVPAEVTHSGETWKLNKSATISVIEHPGMVMSSASDNSTMTINGKIITQDPGDDDGDFAAFASYGEDNNIRVGHSGKLSGEIGANLLADGQSFANYGEVSGSKDGVRAWADDLHIANRGTLSGQANAIDIHGAGNVIVNSAGGTISAKTFAIHATGDDHSHTLIINNGLIASTSAIPIAISASDNSESVEVVHNRGQIKGAVLLGGGDDVFDGRKGSVDGLVIGGNGNDTYLVGPKSDYTIGEEDGGGSDTIKAFGTYHAQAGVSVEDIELQGRGNFDLFGNDDGNCTLGGNTGRNHIVGGAGHEALAGGTGDDVLTGGAGADIFIFETGWDKDVITDFKPGEDRLFLQGWDEIEDFTDLVKHHLTQHGDNLVIHSGDDQLVLKHVHIADLHTQDVSFGTDVLF